MAKPQTLGLNRGARAITPEDDEFTLAELQAIGYALELLYSQKLRELNACGFFQTDKFSGEGFTPADCMVLRGKVVRNLGRALVKAYGPKHSVMPPLTPRCAAVGAVLLEGSVLVAGRLLHLGQHYWIRDHHHPFDGVEVVLREVQVGATVGEVECHQTGARYRATLSTLQEVKH